MSLSFSFNPHVNAMLALQNLSATAASLSSTQLDITTGLAVNGPQDDASTFAIAQNLRGTIAGDQSVQTALATGQSVTSVAINAGQSIADLLTQAKAKVVEANQGGLDSTSSSALNNDFQALTQQIDSIVTSASFNNVNLISSGASNLSVLSTADGSTITVSAQNLSTTGLGISGLNLTTSGGAATALSAINTAITSVSNKLAALGSAASSIDNQSTFTGQLIDVLNQGVGNLVDANMAQESAQLQSLQIKQQLGVQALSISNQAPQLILSLFR